MQASKQDSNIYGYGIWTHHIVFVVKYAKLLAQQLNADSDVVEIAALLHDYAVVKDEKYALEHHIYGAQFAEEILEKFGYEGNKIGLVKNCILTHRGSVRLKQESPEAICVASADGMAHIDQVVSLLHLVFYERRLGTDEGKKWVKDKLERTWNKLCPEAKEIIKNKYDAAMIVLS